MDTEPGLQAASLGLYPARASLGEEQQWNSLFLEVLFLDLDALWPRALSSPHGSIGGRRKKVPVKGSLSPCCAEQLFCPQLGGGEQHNTEGMAGTMCGKAIKFLLPALFFNGCLVLVPSCSMHWCPHSPPQVFQLKTNNPKACFPLQGVPRLVAAAASCFCPPVLAGPEPRHTHSLQHLY